MCANRRKCATDFYWNSLKSVTVCDLKSFKNVIIWIVVERWAKQLREAEKKRMLNLISPWNTPENETKRQYVANGKQIEMNTNRLCI